MTSQDLRVVEPGRTLGGTLKMPGDKSISHRAIMLSALGDGESTVEGFLESEDCLNTLQAMQAMGAAFRREGAVIRIQGTRGALRAPVGDLDMGNSGTSMRLISGIIAGMPFTATLSGDASLRSRPMRRIREPLERMGAQVELLGPNGCAPVRIRGGSLRGIEYALPVASAQVKSCVLLAGLFATGRTTVIEPAPTRDHTERMLREAGVQVQAGEGNRMSVDGSAGQPLALRARRWTVPGDFSSAAFWMTAAACREGSCVTIEGVGLNPRRTAFLSVLRRMGADVEVREAAGVAGGEPVGTVCVRGRGLTATDVAGVEIPNLIDELPCVAVAGAFAGGTTVIRDAAELRVKESDRIAAMAATLRTFGVRVDELPDGMKITGPSSLRGGGEIDSLGDHRIAMCAALLALSSDAPVRIRQVACIATSYPTFWEHLALLTGRK